MAAFDYQVWYIGDDTSSQGATEEILGTPGSLGVGLQRVPVAETTHGLNRSATDTAEDAGERKRERETDEGWTETRRKRERER